VRAPRRARWAAVGGTGARRDRDALELVLERAVQSGRRRRDVGAEEVDVEPLEAAQRPEAVALALRGRDGGLPVGLHAEHARADREAPSARDEDDRLRRK
jgi:hypothetical protein